MNPISPTIKFLNSYAKGEPLWFDYVQCDIWMRRLVRGLMMAFIEENYDTDINFKILFGAPLGSPKTSIGYCDIESDEKDYLIFIAPGKMCLDELIATTMHEMIHVYCGQMNHEKGFINACQEFGLIYRGGDSDYFSNSSKIKIKHILSVIGLPPKGLTTSLTQQILAPISNRWAKSSTIYCEKCNWSDVLFFSNLKKSSICPMCGSNKIHEIQNHPSMITSDLFVDLPVSSPWCGDISPYQRRNDNALSNVHLINTTTCFFTRRSGRIINRYPLIVLPINGEENYKPLLESSIGTTVGWSIKYIKSKSYLYEFGESGYGIILTASSDSTFNRVPFINDGNLKPNDLMKFISDSSEITKRTFLISETTKLNDFFVKDDFQ
jgi:hypothetical protein